MCWYITKYPITHTIKWSQDKAIFEGVDEDIQPTEIANSEKKEERRKDLGQGYPQIQENAPLVELLSAPDELRDLILRRPIAIAKEWPKTLRKWFRKLTYGNMLTSNLIVKNQIYGGSVKRLGPNSKVSKVPG
ncbi:hypothetical protein JTB14_019583 [Gonioctena quinquepunctata]|nr:hypothetical protein JTB14_019583 [Gonioctena quinquepunctata]